MKDFLRAYRKNAVRKNASIAAAALVFALSVNAFLFGTDSGVRLQTSAVQYAAGTSGTDSPDLVLVSAGTGSDMAKLTFAKGAKSVKEIRATVVSDSASLKVKDVFTTDASAEITKVSNVEGVMLVNVRYGTAKDIAAGTEIAAVALQKTGTGKSVLTLVETAFVSGNETYELTNAALEF